MNAPEKFPSVRDQLRAATDEIHQALHRATPFAAIADGTATLESYGCTLRFLHRIHSALSAHCLRGANGLGVPQLASAHARRIAMLEIDLACLGVMADAPDDAAPDAGEAFCAGVLYTVQGSTLGGKLIYRQLDALLPGDSGRNFFKGSAEDSRDWQSLCAALERRPEDLADMRTGSLYAFARFQDMLNR
jgi:heme oxygenase